MDLDRVSAIAVAETGALAVLLIAILGARNSTSDVAWTPKG
jgi:hypothetical protein